MKSSGRIPLLPAVLTLALVSAAWAQTAAVSPPPSFGANVQLRGQLANSRLRFEREKKGHVAFMGGSITEMNGFRPKVYELLKKHFPNTEFKFTDAGISSTCSTTGAFRLGTDALGDGPVDLFFVEFAVNDDQDAAHTRSECIRGLEGIIRQCLRSNPNMDIVVIYFVNEGMLKTLQSGTTPLTIEAHETVALHYSVSSVNLAKEVAEEITGGKLTWQQYGGVHPGPIGNTLCATMIDSLFARAWSEPLPTTAVRQANPKPAQPLDAYNYERGRFIAPQEAAGNAGFLLGVPDWKSLAGSKRSRFTSIPMLSATEPGAQTSLSFEGTAIGAYIVAGPDAGVVEASVDGGPFQPVNLYHHFSAGLHYPRTVMFGAELKPGKHRLTLRMSKDTKSSGHAMRIMQFVAN